MPALLRWSESAPAENVVSAHELRSRLTQLNDSRERPLMVDVQNVSGLNLILALDGEESVVIVHRLRERDDGLSLEWISRAQTPRTGFTDYFLLDAHHTELPNEYRIPTSIALDAVDALFNTGELPSAITWDTNTF